MIKPNKTVRGILTESYLHELVQQRSSGGMRWFVVRSKRLDDQPQSSVSAA